MNTIISKIAAVESFVWKEIPLSFSLMLVAYFSIISWTIWLQKPKFNTLIMALGSLLLFQTLLFTIKWEAETKEELIVFNTLKKSIIGTRNGTSISLLTSAEIVENSHESRMLQSYATANFSNTKQSNPLPNTVYFKHKKILIVDSTTVYRTSITPDIIILSRSPKINLDRLLATQKPEVIIADGSNYKSYVEIWKQSCLKKKIPFHSTYEKGYFSIKE